MHFSNGDYGMEWLFPVENLSSEIAGHAAGHRDCRYNEYYSAVP